MNLHLLLFETIPSGHLVKVFKIGSELKHLTVLSESKQCLSDKGGSIGKHYSGSTAIGSKSVRDGHMMIQIIQYLCAPQVSTTSLRDNLVVHYTGLHSCSFQYQFVVHGVS